MTKSSLTIIFLSFLVQLFSAKSNPLASAIYVFGDSLSECGNNNNLNTVAKANFPPYGVDFPGQVTGRYSNGKTVADILAEDLGLPFAPPYLGLSDVKRAKTATGVNYASSACGILDETGRKYGECLSLKKQVHYFQNTVEKDLPKKFRSPKALSDHLSKAIFVVTTGNNDYLNNYLEPSLNTSKGYTPKAFSHLLIKHLSRHLQKLYKLGARKMLVFQIGPIGCMPAVMNKVNAKSCIKELNDLVSIYNRKLPALLKKMTSTLDGLISIHGDNYAISLAMFKKASKLGKINNQSINLLRHRSFRILTTNCQAKTY
ncbi:GDSL esterase/lipase 7-like [Tasmannia lanceolata]|uniref:GDSL esterase/lipase 7-like n=1 Tax=Tasmannia lanceolata TaxID=3420 RepID=UPI004063F18D